MGFCNNNGSLLFLITIFSLPLISPSTSNNLWRRNLSTTTSPQPPVAAPTRHRVYPFRPSIGVIVGVVTIIFIVTFLLLLYAKHCKRSNTYDYTFSINGSRRFPPLPDRKDSGVERTVVESLPVFRFESLRGQKDGLECAVCLNKFEANDLLRLLPKCKHGFHVECVDTWLDAHSTCPLCRHRIISGDFSLMDEYRSFQQDEVPTAPVEISAGDVVTGGVSRVSGRHSFDGSSGSLEVILETARNNLTQQFMGRRSLDSWVFRKKTTSETVVVDCFERPRKDELLLTDTTTSTGPILEQRRHLDHQIIVSNEVKSEDHEEEQPNHRWSDVQQSDLLLLCSEMILSDNVESMQSEFNRDVFKGRSLSEITGFSRFMMTDAEHQNERRRQAAGGAVSRWFAWISPAQTYQNPQRRKPPSASVITCKLQQRNNKYTRSNSSLA